MGRITVDFQQEIGKVKPLHAVNNGPKGSRPDQSKGNFVYYKAAKIPYARNHDASFSAAYGGEHTVDVHAIFPNFDADVNDPDSYDFVCTDKYTSEIYAAGTKVFYRLGTKIEHGIKKYNTLPPKDFKKWAEICEHIIAHYTEGWADGFQYDMEYWEIWNEPDQDPDDSPNKRTWGGTKAQFFDMYEIVAKHLKGRFPNLKIGGPSIAFNEEWTADFLAEMKKRNVPMDFFSWHCYCVEPEAILGRAERYRKMLDDNGYENAESILNEWNYVADWGKDFVESLLVIHGMKGAAFTAACMLASQESSIDMLMYYDARTGTGFNGMFDFYTCRPLKGYYPFTMFSTLYELGTAVKCSSDDDRVYVVGAKDESGKAACMLVYYTDDDTAQDVTLQMQLQNANGEFEVYLLDEEHTDEYIKDVSGDFELTLQRNSVVLLKQK